MRILVTRPQREAERTAARLVALGHEVCTAPVIEIVATETALPPGPFDAVLATSAQAIRHLDAAARSAIAALPLLAVGEKTANAARTAGFADVRPPAPDAHHLAQTLAASYARAARFLYLAGRDRKPQLEAILTGAGHRIEVMVDYEARAVAALPEEAREALRREEIDAILHYSRRSAAIFRRLVDVAGVAEGARQALHVCISADAATPLQGWASRLVIAGAPNEVAMMAELDRSGRQI